MDIGFWAARWSEGKIGFHEGRANHFLAAHIDELGSERTVLVPLCGKSEDLAFLAGRGHHVVGIEAVEDAVKAFFAEHGITPAVAPRGKLIAYTAGNLTLLAGDFFAATREDVGPVDALYDRAALVALPPDVRVRYAAHCESLLSPGAKGLLVTFEYPEDTMAPPPHSVREPEVRALYTNVRFLEEALDDQPRFKERGVVPLERCYAVGWTA